MLAKNTNISPQKMKLHSAITRLLILLLFTLGIPVQAQTVITGKIADAK